ncbi:MAG: hypothetical protein H5T84_11185 [Thermoleophilia bacterium]|nr:hypothetical protein [Thermoleophilia bacterium]
MTQAGSSIRPDKLRFDFVYHEPLGPERLREIEDLINRRIVENHPVRVFTTSLEHARDLGAIALFGEKYGDFVRVVEIDDFSRELCGGTHVAWTSELGIFKIISEGSVGANVRRIEAITGPAAVAYYRERDQLVEQAATALGAVPDQVLAAIEKLRAAVDELEAELQRFISEKSKEIVQELVGKAERREGVAVVADVVEVRDMDHLLSLADQVRDHCRPCVAVLGAKLGGKGVLVVAADSDLKQIHAGQLTKETVRGFGGGGGGNERLGRGGGLDPRRLEEVVAAARQAVWEALGM